MLKLKKMFYRPDHAAERRQECPSCPLKAALSVTLLPLRNGEEYDKILPEYFPNFGGGNIDDRNKTLCILDTDPRFYG